MSIITDDILNDIMPGITIDMVKSATKGNSKSNNGLNVLELKKILSGLGIQGAGRMTRKQLQNKMILLLPKPRINVNVNVNASAKKNINIEDIIVKSIGDVRSRKQAFLPPVCVSRFICTKDMIDSYIASMKPLLFSTCPITNPIVEYDRLMNHTGNMVSPNILMKHVHRYIPNDIESLLSWSSGIFVRVSELDASKLQFMIVGPRDTPYQNGLFHFSMDFPDQYPSQPPVVKILNTGGGRYRANPNLYAGGKVCLSLLNTWTGEVRWSSKRSPIDILLGIQAQILNIHPFRNEPGHEKAPFPDCEAYNAVIRLYTMKLGMIDMIQNPPAGFEDVVKAHFSSSKKAEIIGELDDWMQMAESVTRVPGYAFNRENFCTNLHELKFMTQTFSDMVRSLLAPSS